MRPLIHAATQSANQVEAAHHIKSCGYRSEASVIVQIKHQGGSGCAGGDDRKTTVTRIAAVYGGEQIERDIEPLEELLQQSGRPQWSKPVEDVLSAP